MQTRKTGNKRQKRAAALAILLALILILGIVLPVIGMTANAMTVSVTNSITAAGGEEGWTGPQAAEEMENPDLHMAAEVGFGGTYLLEHATPFAITLENTGADFTGQVEVKVYNYLGDEYTDADYSVYYQPVELSSGSVKRVDMEITVTMLSRFFQISLVNAQGVEVCRKNAAATPRDPGTVLVGLLSDHPENLSYARRSAPGGRHRECSRYRHKNPCIPTPAGYHTPQKSRAYTPFFPAAASCFSGRPPHPAKWRRCPLPKARP